DPVVGHLELDLAFPLGEKDADLPLPVLGKGVFHRVGRQLVHDDAYGHGCLRVHFDPLEPEFEEDPPGTRGIALEEMLGQFLYVEIEADAPRGILGAQEVVEPGNRVDPVAHLAHRLAEAGVLAPIRLEGSQAGYDRQGILNPVLKLLQQEVLLLRGARQSRVDFLLADEDVARAAEDHHEDADEEEDHLEEVRDDQVVASRDHDMRPSRERGERAEEEGYTDELPQRRGIVRGEGQERARDDEERRLEAGGHDYPGDAPGSGEPPGREDEREQGREGDEPDPSGLALERNETEALEGDSAEEDAVSYGEGQEVGDASPEADQYPGSELKGSAGYEEAVEDRRYFLSIEEEQQDGDGVPHRQDDYERPDVERLDQCRPH